MRITNNLKKTVKTKTCLRKKCKQSYKKMFSTRTTTWRIFWGALVTSSASQKILLSRKARSLCSLPEVGVDG